MPVLQCSLHSAPCTLQPATSPKNASATLAGRGCSSGSAQVGLPSHDCVRQPAAVLHGRGPAAIAVVAAAAGQRSVLAASIQAGVGASAPGGSGPPAAARCGQEPPSAAAAAAVATAAAAAATSYRSRTQVRNEGAADDPGAEAADDVCL